MKKLLLPLLCLLPMAMPANAETKTYQLCTSEAEILNPDNKFILVSSKTFTVSNKTSVYAAQNLTTGKGVALAEYATVPEEITVDAENSEIGVFSVFDNGEDYKVLYEHGKNLYWGGPNKNNISTSETLGSGNDYKLTFSFDPVNYTVKITSQTVSNRWFQFNSGTNFRNYLSDEKYCMPLFYKEVVKVKAPEYKGFSENYEILKDEELSFPNILPSELTYTFTSSDESIIKVDKENKKFIPVNYGVATIKFSTPEMGDFLAGEGSFTISVNKLKPILAFRDQIVYGKLGVGVVWEPVQIITEMENHGTITYTSSDPSIVSIDAQTGQIHPAIRDEETGEIIDEGDIHAKGEVVITAVMEETEDYSEAKASYTIIIKDPSEPIEGTFADSVIFDFTTENPYGMTSTSNSNTYETGVHEIKVPGNQDVTITFPPKSDDDPADNNYRSWSASGTYQLRMNKGARFIVSVADGYKISKIGLTGSVANGTTYTPAGDAITTADKNEEGWETLKSTWITKDDEVVTEVRFDYPSSVSSGNVRIDKIYVMYESISSSLSPADLSFETVVYSLYMNEPDKINAVINPHGREITYRIPALDPTEEELANSDYKEKYSITDLGNGMLEVFVTEPGYYSLEAVSPMDDTYRDGLAILRLNVFYHLPVYVNGVLHEYPIGMIDVAKEDVTITMDVPELMNLYYRVYEDPVNVPAEKPVFRAEGANDEEDENLQEGFTKYDNGDGIEIPQGTKGDLHFYIANYGYSSPVRKLGLSTPVGVEEVVAPAEGNVRYYDLSGRMVSGKLLPGVYVRKDGSRTEKVLVK